MCAIFNYLQSGFFVVLAQIKFYFEIWENFGLSLKMFSLLLGFSFLFVLYIIFSKFIELYYFNKIGNEFEDYVRKAPKLFGLNAEDSMFFQLYDKLLTLNKDPYTEGKRSLLANEIYERIKSKWEILFYKKLLILSLISDFYISSGIYMYFFNFGEISFYLLFLGIFGKFFVYYSKEIIMRYFAKLLNFKNYLVERFESTV